MNSSKVEKSHWIDRNQWHEIKQNSIVSRFVVTCHVCRLICFVLSYFPHVCLKKCKLATCSSYKEQPFHFYYFKAVRNVRKHFQEFNISSWTWETLGKYLFNLEIQKLHFQGKRISQMIFGTIHFVKEEKWIKVDFCPDLQI
jgi:hypothetical protein